MSRHGRAVRWREWLTANRARALIRWPRGSARLAPSTGLPESYSEAIASNVLSRPEEFILAANKSLYGLPSVNDAEGRTAVVEIFKVALHH